MEHDKNQRRRCEHQSWFPSVDASQKRFAFAGMNPDFLADGGADFRLDAFNEAHADPAEFIGWPDRGGDFQCGLFYFAPAQMRSGVDVFQRVRHFSCFHIFFLVASLIHSTTTLFYQAHFCWIANLATEAMQTLNETAVAADA
ncbi:MAG TPA: hypothetical protein VIK35_12900 [Verrucomicrobiae bacterium]